MKLGLLAIQGSIAPHADACASLGVAAVEVRTPAHPADVDALVVPGGESTTMSKLLIASGLDDPLHRRLNPTWKCWLASTVTPSCVDRGRPWCRPSTPNPPQIPVSTAFS